MILCVMIVLAIPATFSIDFSIPCGFTQDFDSYLRANSPFVYSSALPCAQFGGRNSSNEPRARVPLVFVHGNSDLAFGRGSLDGYKDWQTGFRSLAGFLLGQGYLPGQLYTYTWGNANQSQAYLNHHRKEDLFKLRAFLQAVLAYTGASQIDVVGHSMGVTLARKAIQGGLGKDENEGSYDLGPPIRIYVRAFIGIAGANLGLTACYSTSTLPTCSPIDGLYPGLFATSGPSEFLKGLEAGSRQSTRVFSVWSQFDNVIGDGCLVYGKVTSRIRGQDAQVVKKSIEWSHFALRDNSGPDILALLAKTGQPHLSRSTE